MSVDMIKNSYAAALSLQSASNDLITACARSNSGSGSGSMWIWFDSAMCQLASAAALLGYTLVLTEPTPPIEDVTIRGDA